MRVRPSTLALIGAVLLLAFALLRHARNDPSPPSPTAARISAAQVAPGAAIARPGEPPPDEPPFAGIDELNATGRTIHQDLQLLSDVFASWQTNFPQEGNPWGENADITAALSGRNRLKLVMIPRRHPAINADGELVDRWGTPFFFHQLGGTRMEIRSAGPDRRYHTPDDVVLTP